MSRSKLICKWNIILRKNNTEIDSLKENYKELLKDSNSYENHNKDIEARNIMYLLECLLGLNLVLIIITEYNQLIAKKHIHMKHVKM